MYRIASTPLVSAFWLSVLIPQGLGLPDDLAALIGATFASAIVAFDFDQNPVKTPKLTASHVAAAIAGVLFAPIVSIATAWIAHLMHIPGPKNAIGGRPVSLPMFVTAIFLSPLIEEYVFRGRLLTCLRDRVGSSTAVLMSAALFGLIHLNVWLSLGAFLSGIVLGYIGLVTRGISHSALFHTGLNLCGLLGGFVLSAPPRQVATIACCWAIALAASIYFFHARPKSHA